MAIFNSYVGWFWMEKNLTDSPSSCLCQHLQSRYSCCSCTSHDSSCKGPLDDLALKWSTSTDTWHPKKVEKWYYHLNLVGYLWIFTYVAIDTILDGNKTRASLQLLATMKHCKFHEINKPFTNWCRISKPSAVSLQFRVFCFSIFCGLAPHQQNTYDRITLWNTICYGTWMNIVFSFDEAIHNWLVVSTTLKNISQLGWLFPIYGTIKHVPNHQPDNHH